MDRSIASLEVGVVGRPERVAIFTALGIRFWDMARDEAIRDGLHVTAWPPGRPDLARPAARAASGVFAFHRLPGMHSVEYPVADERANASPPSARRFVVRVADRSGRFLPAVFGVDVPYQGLFPTETVSPLTGNKPPGFYLFSAPTRRAGSSTAVVRAQLLDIDTGQPAAYAVLELAVPGPRAWYGVADERGAVAVHFPYPTFRGPVGGSPMSFPVDPGGQRWAVTVRVRYAPALRVVPAGADVPELRSIFGQTAGVLWPTLQFGPSGPAGQLVSELVVGEELVLRTDDGSELLVGQSVSPP
jgi:hypothetical protein